MHHYNMLVGNGRAYIIIKVYKISILFTGSVSLCDLWAVAHGVVLCIEVAVIVGLASVEYSDREVRC